MKKNLLYAPSNSILSKQKSHYLQLLFILYLFLGISTNVTAQVSTYTYGEVSGGSYTALSGATDLFGATPNDQQTAVGSEITIGFNFIFNGTTYTNLRVNANGYLVFGGNAALPVSLPISSGGNYTGAIAGYGRDLIYSSYGSTPIYSAATYPSSVSYLLSGIAGSRVFTVQFRNMARLNTASTVAPYDGLVNFQIKLYEGSNVVQVVHDTQIVPTTGVALVGQDGLRGATAADYNVRLISTGTPWAATTAAGAATQGINYRNNCYLGGVMTMTWTPPCYSPTTPTVGSITTSSALVGWTAPATAPPGYNYEVRSSGAAGSGSTGLGASGTITGVSTTASGLADGTTYILYVKSSCSSTWVTGPTFTTLCAAKNIPYTRNFNEGDYTVPAIPNCLSIQNMGSGNNWTSSAVTASSTTAQFLTNHLVYDSTVGVGSTQNANVWAFTPGLNLTTGVTYKLTYDYGGSTELATYTNKMIVKYGTAASDAGMTITLVDHDNIKASPISSSISFTVSAPGVYYIGFKAYSNMANGRLFLDNIQVTQPGCVAPSGLSVGSITSSTATATWTVPTPAPGNGYDYYLLPATSIAATAMVNGTVYKIVTPGTTNFTSFGSSSNAAGTVFTATGPGTGTGTVCVIPSNPSYTQLVTGSTPAGTNLVNLTGLSGNTAYFVWVRGNCGSNDSSQWSSVYSFITPAQLVYCTPTSSSTASYISNFTTTGGAGANISNSSTFSAGAYGNYTAQVVKQVAGGSVNFSMRNSDSFLGAGMAGWVDWDNSGTFTNSAPDERFYTSSNWVFGGPVTGTINVPGGQATGNYRIRILSDYNNSVPTNPCGFAIGNRGEIEDYTFTVVLPPLPLALSTGSSTQCAGANSPLITITPATVGNYDIYTWSPSTGVTGNSGSGYVINTTTTQTYTLTGFNSTTFQTNTVSFIYTATQLPTAISIAPATTTICQNASAVQLVSTGGQIPGLTVLSEDFNSTPGSTLPTFINASTPAPTVWTSTNNGTGGTPANAEFTIRASGYDAVSWVGTNIIRSNDNTQFIFTDGDAQGGGGTNNTTLVSPVFSLPSPTYTSALLSFYHYFRRWSFGDIFIGVELSTDGGSTWPIVLQSYNSDQGTLTNFSNVTINLNPYIGQTNLRLRFRYNSVYGYGWAIDNFVISATASSNTSWNTQTTPVADGVAVPGLYTNAGATTAYVAGTKSTSVYALPTTSTTYVASASTVSPSVCTVSATTTVNITPIFGGVASSDQVICGGAPADLQLANSIGSIQWEYGNNSGFTPAPTTIGGGTGTTLTSAQMGGVLASDRYFRAVLTVAGCSPAYSNTISVLTSGATTTWSAGAWSAGVPTSSSAVVFNSNFTSSVNAGPSGNLSACSVVVSNGANVVFDTGTLSVQNNVNVNAGGTLSFKDKASLYQVANFANSAGVYSGGNVGSINYERISSPLFKFDYTYWASPVHPQLLTPVSPNSPQNLYYEYTTGWTVIPSPSTTVMTPGKGYIFRAPVDYPVTGPATPLAYAAPFAGVPNNGTISIPVIGGAGQMNLLGNPYPSALSADAFLLDPSNAATLSGSIYLWTHNTPMNAAYQYTGSDYAIYNYLGGTVGGVPTGAATNPGLNMSIPTGKIASGQGFFVKGLANSTATFKNSMRIAGNNDQFFKMSSATATTSEPEKHRYWLDISNTQGAFKQVLVGYVEGATVGIDRLYDGDMVDVGNAAVLYTIAENTKLSIQGRPLPFDVDETLPLGYKSTIVSTYSIKLSAFDGLFTSQKVYLEDTLLNVIHDLTTSPYTFATEIGTFDTRFKLRYTANALGVDNPVFNSNSVVVYKNAEGLNINSGSAIMSAATIFDVQGRVLASQKNISDSKTVFTTLPITQQVLFVRIESENGEVVTKKIAY